MGTIETNSDNVICSVKVPLEDVPWGRDYRLNVLPRNASGEILFRDSSVEEYHAYVNWLENYLYAATCKPGRKQTVICAYLSGYNFEFALQLLAMNAVSYEADMVGVELYIIDPETEEEEGYYTKEQIQRAKREKRQMLKYGLTEEDAENFCDIGWRIPLASIMKKIPEKKERIRLLRVFFEMYQEYSRK